MNISTATAEGKSRPQGLHFQIGDHVQLNGRRAHIVASAAINGPDWWELELDDEFFLVPDGSGGRIRTSQAFAPEVALKPAADAKAPATAAGAYYAIAPCGIVYGPPVGMDEAIKLVARHSGGNPAGWYIVTLDDLADTLAKLDAVMEANYRARMNSMGVH